MLSNKILKSRDQHLVETYQLALTLVLLQQESKLLNRPNLSHREVIVELFVRTANINNQVTLRPTISHHRIGLCKVPETNRICLIITCSRSRPMFVTQTQRAGARLYICERVKSITIKALCLSQTRLIVIKSRLICLDHWIQLPLIISSREARE